jgi:hypothetical protein
LIEALLRGSTGTVLRDAVPPGNIGAIGGREWFRVGDRRRESG